MKRYIRANNERLQKVYYRFEKPSLKNYRLSGKLDEEGGYFFGQVTKISPYDDADYWWARINGGGLIELIHDGKVQDTIEYAAFEEDDYETVAEYVNEMAEVAAENLVELNKSIRPVMIHN